MDLLETQIAHYTKGSAPTQKAKAHILRMLQHIEAAHTKIEKITKSKEALEGFLDKCIQSTTKPKLLREIADISVEVDESRALLTEAKAAEEKRQERAAKREAAKATKPATMAAAVGILGGITVNVNIQQGGAVQVTAPVAPPPAKKDTKTNKKANKGPKETYKKQPIPKSVRKHVWNHYIGTEKGEAPCYCCHINRIDKAAFEAGHVVPEVRGGPSTLENLRPICGECNRSMGDTDMREFAHKHYGRSV
jgi:actin-related protein